VPPSPRLQGAMFAALFVSLATGLALLEAPRAAATIAEPVATGLDWPVSFAFAPNGSILYNERFTGNLRAIVGGRLVPGALGNVSVETAGEQGLLGLALHPSFAADPWAYVYQTYFNESEVGVVNRVVRLWAGPAPTRGAEVILDGIPASTFHNGGILGFAPDDTLFITTGDATNPANGQDNGTLAGKVLRIREDGTIPPDNPIPGSPVYSLGHRNLFGLAFHPATGRPYVSENGPFADDEVNLIEPGRNYGWPDVTGAARQPRFVDPIVTYAEVIAPTGLAFAGDDLFLGDWNRGIVQRIVLAPPEFRTFVRNETIAAFGSQGVLDVETGPDDSLYLSTTDAIYRIVFTGDASWSPLPFVLGAVAVAVPAAVVAWIVLRRRFERSP